MILVFTGCSKDGLSPEEKKQNKKCDKSSSNSVFLSPGESFDENCNIVGTKSIKTLREEKCDKLGINSFFLSVDEEFDRNCNVVKSKK